MKATTCCKLYLRSGPSNVFFYPVKRIPAGTTLTVLEPEGNWLQVRSNDKVGYFPKDHVCLDLGGDDNYFELAEVLYEELRHIRTARGKEEGDDPLCAGTKENRFRDLLPRLHRAKLVALCLSGGGIRSATFNLGILQGLAKTGVLKEVDYLSTVSGGGYIGSWLSSWISREEGNPAGKLDKVITTLAEEGTGIQRQEPYQVRFLRDYSNYLTPRVGIFSIDTWAIIGTYLRNLLLNWLVLLPLLFACLLVPRILIHFASGGVIPALALIDGKVVAHIFALAGAALGVFPIAYTITDLPGIGNMRRSKSSFTKFFLVPLVLMACFLSSYWGYTYRPGCDDVPGLLLFAGFATVVHGPPAW